MTPRSPDIRGTEKPPTPWIASRLDNPETVQPSQGAFRARHFSGGGRYPQFLCHCVNPLALLRCNAHWIYSGNNNRGVRGDNCALHDRNQAGLPNFAASAIPSRNSFRVLTLPRLLARPRFRNAAIANC